MIFRSFDQGDRTVCREIHVPTPEEEDAKRLDRERLQLSAERTRHVNRIRALLNLHGIREVKALWGGVWRKWLQMVKAADDEPLGKFLAAELTREFERERDEHPIFSFVIAAARYAPSLRGAGWDGQRLR